MSWYQGKVAYQQEQENGALKTIVEAYLLDAVSFTDAEARLAKVMEENNTPDYAVKTISRKKLSDVFDDELSGKWWQAKIVYMSFNEISGKDKRIPNDMLVRADSLKDAYDKIIDGLKGMLIPYEIEGLVLSPILAIYKYQAEEPN